MPDVKYKVRDFFDVHLGNKIIAVHRYIHRVAYDDQKPIKTRLFADTDNILAHALHDHYCITLIECPFKFNFESLLNQFGWFCQFMYFNFSETKIQFDILKKLREKNLSQHEIDLLLDILAKDPEPYQFPLNTYQGKAKFSLMKRQNMGDKGSVAPFAERDQQFRLAFTYALKTFRDEIQQQTEPVLPSEDNIVPLEIGNRADAQTEEATTKKYEPSLYGYLKLNENLTFDQQEIIIHYLYDLLKDLFYKECSFEDFEAAFLYQRSAPILLDISKPNGHHFDAQRLHWLLRSLKDTRKLLATSWDVVSKKIVVYNQRGRIIKSVYQISESKISPQKRRQVEKLLRPLFDQLPEYPSH
jgi:hypothetical protein